MHQNSRVRQRSAPAQRGRSAERVKCTNSERLAQLQRPAVVGGISQGTYSGFKVAVAVIVFHFGVKMLVQFADILLPFIMALLLSTVLEPVKQVTLEVLECTLIVLFQRVGFCSLCLRRVRRDTSGMAGDRTPEAGATPVGTSHRGSRVDLHELMKRFLLLVSIVITVLLAGRLFWLVGRVVWLSGEAVTHDFPYYRRGVEKRGSQVRHLLKRFHLQQKAQLDMEHFGHWALKLLQYSAEFLTQHVFYTLTQISLTTIFVLFLLYSPVQRDFSPVMRVVFESMELYLKLKTFISLMMGVTNGIALAVIGLELPAAWGLLTFLANFIPNIGGPVMSILPCVIALLDVRKSFYQVSAAFMAQFFLHFNIANFVEPVVFGTTEEIHSVVVLLGLSFFGYIWGFTGMFLSVPMLFAIHAWLKTVAQSLNCAQEARDDARFIMGILEGRWLADDDYGLEEFADMSVLGPMDTQTEGPDSPAPSKEVDSTQNLQSHGQATSETPSDPPRPGPEAMRQDSLTGPEEPEAPPLENQPPISNWKVMSDLQAVLAVRDPDTDEVRLSGLIFRWVCLAGAYIAVFFGFAIFHWDLHALIHPSKEPMNPDVGSVGLNSSASHTGVDADVALSTTGMASTSMLAAATTVVAAAVEATTTAVGTMAGKSATVRGGLVHVGDPSTREVTSLRPSTSEAAKQPDTPTPAVDDKVEAEALRPSSKDRPPPFGEEAPEETLDSGAAGEKSQPASDRGKAGLKLGRPRRKGDSPPTVSTSSTAQPTAISSLGDADSGSANNDLTDARSGPEGANPAQEQQSLRRPSTSRQPITSSSSSSSKETSDRSTEGAAAAPSGHHHHKQPTTESPRGASEEEGVAAGTSSQSEAILEESADAATPSPDDDAAEAEAEVEAGEHELEG